MRVTRSNVGHQNLYDALAYDFVLPPERIAQAPLAERDQSRLLIVQRGGAACRDGRVTDLAELLHEGDLLVLNDTRVIKARIEGKRVDTGGHVEVLIFEIEDGAATAMLRTRGTLLPGERLAAGSVEPLELRAARDLGGGTWRLETGRTPAELLAWLDRFGRVPLPPYIKRARGADPHDAEDSARYQTVFAVRPGAVAAPTAGLHFSERLLGDLERRGVRRASVTLHVGPGTFRPVTSPDVRGHVMHSETFEVPETCAAEVRRTRAAGRRVIAVGTTVVRALESAAAGGEVRPASGSTALFIHPPYAFRAVDALFTNFHAPRSTLLMLTAAFGGRDTVLAAYEHAIRAGYRLLSYGDAMLIV